MFRSISKSLIFSNQSIVKSVRSFGTVEESIFRASRKCIVNNGKDGFIIKSPYDFVDIPETTIDRYVWQNLSKWPNHVAIECSASGKKYTFAELRDRCAALAIQLRRKLHLEQNETVAICLPNVPEYPIALFGSIEAGLTVTTINPGYTQLEASGQIVNSEPKLIFCTADKFEAIKETCVLAKRNDIKIVIIKTMTSQSIPNTAINFEELVDTTGLNLSEASQFNDDVDLNQTVLLPYSSGTTGLPKGVMHSHRTAIANSDVLMGNKFSEPFILPTTSDFQDVVACFLPFYHIYGLSVILLNKLALGCKILSMKYEVNHFLDTIAKHKATILPLVPPVAIHLGNHPATKPDHFKYARNIICGAACLANSDAERLMKIAHNSAFIQGFGMTEGFVTLSSPELRNYGTVGLVLSNMEAKIAKADDASFRGIGAHENGEILTRGPTVMKGYYRNEVANKVTFTDDGWLRTGDIGFYDENGLFYITERLKELIKVNGLQVAPAELESILRNHPDILDAAVVGISHEKCGEIPQAFVVRRPQSKVNGDDVQKFVAKQVSKHKHLTGGVKFVESIPKTASGKILRREIKRLHC